jgi:hypothetical protein
MVHPLLRLVATQPQLLADHVEAYAGLVSEEFGRAASDWKRRALYNAIGLCLIGVAAVLAGVALMLWAVTPLSNMQAPWALFAGPGVPSVIAAICIYVGRASQASAFEDVRQQLSADLEMLRAVSTA